MSPFTTSSSSATCAICGSSPASSSCATLACASITCARDWAFVSRAASRARAASARARAASGSRLGLGVAAAGVAAAGVVSAGAVASEGDGDGAVDGRAVGDEADERAGVGDALGLADGVAVGPSAIAGVPKKDTVKATARSGGARMRVTCTINRRVPHVAQTADTSPLSERARAELARSLPRPFRSPLYGSW